MSNLFAHMERFKTIHLFQLPADYYQNLLMQIDKAGIHEICRVSEKHLNEEELVTAVAG